MGSVFRVPRIERISKMYETLRHEGGMRFDCRSFQKSRGKTIRTDVRTCQDAVRTSSDDSKRPQLELDKDYDGLLSSI